MFDRLVNRVLSVVADVVAWRINRHAEKCALRALELVHLGASVDWVREIVEIRGRHALVAAHH